ncbi:MAG: TRAP transporter substrate-binding protein DctP [Myxococcota bacterium]
MRLHIAIACVWALILAKPVSSEAAPVTIKLATVAPEKTPWHKAVLRMAKRWSEASGGQVRIKIFPGGVAGDEEDMLRKIKVGQLQAASLTGIGLARVSRSTLALQIPMLMQSYEELDHVREAVAPELEKELEEAGYVVLNWGDAGWIHFFSREPVEGPADFAKLKIMVFAKDAKAETAWKAANFNPVPLASTDVLSGLQTGLIDAFASPPLYALSTQWFSLAKHMVPVKWTPLNGATVIDKATWEKIPAELRPELMKIAREEGELSKERVRALGQKSIKAMQKYGLVVHELDEKKQQAWLAAAEKAYPRVRGELVPEEMFDRVKELAEQVREK